MKRSFLSVLNASALIASVVLTGRLTAQASESTLPHLVRKDGRHALIVDGAPFLILGGQSHNSSAWPKALPKVWSAIVTRPALLAAMATDRGEIGRTHQNATTNVRCGSSSCPIDVAAPSAEAVSSLGPPTGADWGVASPRSMA